MLSRLLETLFLTLFYGGHRLTSGIARPDRKRRNEKQIEPGGLPLGTLRRTMLEQMRDPGAKPTEVRLTAEMFSRMGYVLGATGSGKTTLLLRIAEMCLRERLNLVVLDLRGELVRTLLGMAAATLTPEEIASGRVWLLDLEEDAQVVGIDPLRGEGDAQSRAGALHRVLKEQNESWGVQVEETSRAALVALVEGADHDPEVSLVDIERLLLDEAFREKILVNVTDPYTRAFFARYDPKQGYASAVLNKVAPLISHPTLRCLLATPPRVSFAELLNEREGQVLLVNLAVHRLHEAAFLMGGFLISAFQNVFAARIRQPEAERRRTLVMVDEFENFGTGRFAEIVAENRKLRAGLVLAHQTLCQLEPRLRQILLENCACQFYFQCGAHDADLLSRQVFSDEPAPMVRDYLMRQPVGACHLVLRGEPTRRIQVHRGKEPDVSPEAVEKIREAAWSRFALPRPEVEARLRLRAESAEDDPAPEAPAPKRAPRKKRSSTTGSPTSSSVSTPEEPLEVRDYAE